MISHICLSRWLSVFLSVHLFLFYSNIVVLATAAIVVSGIVAVDTWQLVGRGWGEGWGASPFQNPAIHTTSIRFQISPSVFPWMLWLSEGLYTFKLLPIQFKIEQILFPSPFSEVRSVLKHYLQQQVHNSSTHSPAINCAGIALKLGIASVEYNIKSQTCSRDKCSLSHHFTFVNNIRQSKKNMLNTSAVLGWILNSLRTAFFITLF